MSNQDTMTSLSNTECEQTECCKQKTNLIDNKCRKILQVVKKKDKQVDGERSMFLINQISFETSL